MEGLDALYVTTEELRRRQADVPDGWRFQARWTRKEMAELRQANHVHRPFSDRYTGKLCGRLLSWYDTLDWLAHLHLRGTPLPRRDHPEFSRFLNRHTYHVGDYMHAAHMTRALRSFEDQCPACGPYGHDLHCEFRAVLDEWESTLSLLDGERPRTRSATPAPTSDAHQLALF